MTTEVKILLEGYLSNEKKGRCMPTMCLIKSEDVIMISDPGVVENQKVIINALKKEELKIEDINFVFITHSHLDHYKNIGMFPNAKVIEYFGIWEENKDASDWNEDFTKDIKIIKTPGHNYDGLTMLIKTKQGVIAICGDVFWKEGYPKEDPYATDKKKLEQSRKLLLEKADYIIPGHGGMFKT